MPAATAAPGITFEFADAPRTPVEVRTDIAGFVGLAERGPFHRAVRIESWHQYESVFGGSSLPGFLPLAVHAFFGNGGITCDVVRALVPPGAADLGSNPARHASVELPLYTAGGTRLWEAFRIIATSPGTWANGITLVVTPRQVESGSESEFRLTLVVRDRGGIVWRLADCSLDPEDPRFLPEVMAATPDLPVRAAARHTGLPDEEALLRSPWFREPRVPPLQPLSAAVRLSAGETRLDGGQDGVRQLTLEHLCGVEDALDDRNYWGLRALVNTDDVSIVAIPDAVPFPRRPAEKRMRPPRPDCPLPLVVAETGATEPPEVPTEYPPLWTEADTKSISDALIRFCELRRDCVALIDPPEQLRTPLQVQEYRTGFDSCYAGLYWPWLYVQRHPRVDRAVSRTPPSPEFGRREAPESVLGEPMIAAPPSGMVAGLTAAADLLVGPHRTPAGQTARGAIAVTVPVDDDDHGSLNARGINVLRERVGRGVVLEGTRSLVANQSGGNPWRHLNVRRVLLAVLEVIEERTQWAVFEPNDQRLWADLRDVIRNFLTGRWRRGWLSGLRPEDAFFVRCDDATNPPESLELGLVIAHVWLRFPPPIEWIVVRIGRSATGVEVLDVARA
jgi:hypothetical protein